jgi:hypothetical protein
MDRISTSNVSAGFEGIAQMLLEQKKLMESLEAENRDLRRQLDELRSGVGISVVIEGKTIPLSTSSGGEQAKVNVEKGQLADVGGGDRRDTANNNRSPLADSYVL